MGTSDGVDARGYGVVVAYGSLFVHSNRIVFTLSFTIAFLTASLSRTLRTIITSFDFSRATAMATAGHSLQVNLCFSFHLALPLFSTGNSRRQKDTFCTFSTNPPLPSNPQPCRCANSCTHDPSPVYRPGPVFLHSFAIATLTLAAVAAFPAFPQPGFI